ncbi:c-type cytochrome [Salipiger mucosus]|nr:hypothetical protein [Salipiger mucosus]
MKLPISGLSGLGLCLLASAALAQDAGDPDAGERDFRQCRSCHSILGPDGEAIVKGGQVGPNLYGVDGRQAGTVEGFNYSDDMVAAGEQGLMWNLEDFTPYVQGPSGFLQDYTGDGSARGKMTFRLRNAEQAPDIWAYLVSVGPDGGS